MYRNLFAMLLCISTVLGAPQQDSNITYIKLSQEPEFRYTTRETKIDIVPLTVPIAVPDSYSDDNKKQLTNNPAKEAVDQSHEPKNDQPLYNYSDRIYSIKTKKNKKVIDTKTTAAVEAVTEPVISADSFPSETLNTDSIANNENSTQKSETDVTVNYESVTEKSDEVTTTDVNIETTKVPIVTFLPKLSHYGKTKKPFSQNLISVSGKRRFRSRCRCEKIWNCAKLQISVARCPDEYFLCCG